MLKRPKLKPTFGRDVYIVDGSRTPFIKARGRPGPFSAADLAVKTGQILLSHQPFSPLELDEVIMGCIMPSPDEVNIARVISLRLGCGKKVPAFTVQRNCASGLQSIDSAAQNIGSGRSDLILAGGTDAMSRAPVLFNNGMVNWLADFQSSKSFSAKLKTLLKFHPGFLSPIIGLLRGLYDPSVGLSMGQTAEILAARFHISRTQMDEFAARSHARLAHAIDTKIFDNNHHPEITPIYDNQGNYYSQDTGLRRDTTPEQLAKLKPFFDKQFGSVTAGNSSQITDGAAMVILASADAVKKYDLPILGKIIDIQWAGVDPAQMGLGPAYAIPPILERQNLLLNQIDYMEINEAFAAQVLACLRYLDNKKLGVLDQETLNIHGGAISIGHPIGASGTRVTLHLLNTLKQHNKSLGIASLCIGGGMGGAILVENTSTIKQGKSL